MMKKIGTIAACFIFFCSLSMAGSVEILPLKTKFIKEIGGRALFAYKTEVANNSENEVVCATFQAIDHDGFEINHVFFCSKVPVNSTESISRTDTMAMDEWNRIDRWKLKK